MKDKIFVEEDLFDLIRKQQEAILKNRNITFKKSDKEAELVKLILKSNPKVKTETETIIKYNCPKCFTEMVLAGRGKSGQDFKCPNCGHGLTKLIIRR